MESKWYLLESARIRFVLAHCFKTLRKHSVEPILIKGWIAARNYPESHFRSYGDIDIAVREDQFLLASSTVKTRALAPFRIDLHLEFRHLDQLAWQSIFDRSELVEIGGIGVRVPCAEDHLRIMAVHWLNDGGQYRERLWDIYYAVANRPVDFDWKECLDVVSATRRKWVVVAIGLANKYLGLDIDELPFADEARDIPKWVTDTVEAEWATEIRLRPMHTIWKQPRLLIQQLRKRFPPNPIQATIECEGEFDDGSRLPYQIRSIFKRTVPSLKRIVGTLLPKRPPVK